MYESDNEQSKREFYYHENNDNKNDIENEDSIDQFTRQEFLVRYSYI